MKKRKRRRRMKQDSIFKCLPSNKNQFPLTTSCSSCFIIIITSIIVTLILFEHSTSIFGYSLQQAKQDSSDNNNLSTRVSLFNIQNLSSNQDAERENASTSGGGGQKLLQLSLPSSENKTFINNKSMVGDNNNDSFILVDNSAANLSTDEYENVKRNQHLPPLERISDNNNNNLIQLEDPLLAIETSRILTIGRQQNATTTTIIPPYEDNRKLLNISTTRPNYNLLLNHPFLNISQLNRFYNLQQQQQKHGSLPTTTTFHFNHNLNNNQQLGTSEPLDRRLVFGAEQATEIVKQQRQLVGNKSNLNYNPTTTTTTTTTTTIGRPVISRTPQLSWSAYSHYLNQTNPRASNENKLKLNETTTRERLQEQQQQQQAEFDHQFKEDLNQNKLSPINSSSNTSELKSEVEYEQQSFEVSKLSKINDLNNNNDLKTTTTTIKTKFPSLLTTGSVEDEFELNLALGNYQRTNYSTNMSWPDLLKQATENNIMESLTVTNRSMVSLVCDTNDMLLKLKFKKPFHGIVMTNLDKLKVCKLIGNGMQYYEMRISLKDCGTKQEQQRLFINNIQIQFKQQQQHESALNLQMGQDDDLEVKTIICSYPIRPRAQQPSDLNATFSRTNQSDRIIATPTSDFVEPAKLVHYEPIVLISGLILISLIILAFMTSAYVHYVTRRNQRGGANLKRFNSNNTTTERLYGTQANPLQLTNSGGPFQPNGTRSPALDGQMLTPPLIGLAPSRTMTKKLIGNKRASLDNREKSIKQHKITNETSRNDLVESRIKRYPNKGAANINSTLTKGRLSQKQDDLSKLKNQEENINLKPNDDTSSATDDSLNNNSKKDRLSITTIDIPYSTKNKEYAMNNQLNKYSQNEQQQQQPSYSIKINSPRHVEEKRIDKKLNEKIAKEVKSENTQTPLGIDDQTHMDNVDSKLTSSITNKNDNKEELKQTPSSTTMIKRMRKSSKRIERVSTILDNRPNKYSTSNNQQASKTINSYNKHKHVQAEPDLTTTSLIARSGSLRTRLTSPSEYRRLQEIVKLFDEILIENRVKKVFENNMDGDNKTLVVYNTRLTPSKYKSKILDTLDEDERRLLSDSLRNDELFRSLIVDSIDKRETFNRKLRDNIIYSNKFKPDTWNLLEEILMDQNLAGNFIPDEQYYLSKKVNSPHGRVFDNKTSNLTSLTSKTKQEKTNSIETNKILTTNKTVSKVIESEGNDSIVDEGENYLLNQLDSSLKHRSDSLTSLTNLSSNDKPENKAKTNDKKTKPASKREGSKSPSTKSIVRVSQFNSSKLTNQGGMTGTLINIDSITNFTNSKDFTSYTRSSIEHKRTDFELSDKDSLPYVDDEKVTSYQYSNEETKQSPINNNTFTRKSSSSKQLPA